MEGFGKRLRARAKELELSDSEVARRLGLGQSRYAHYVNGTREPDHGTLVRICHLLATTPNVLLGFEPFSRTPEDEVRLRDRIEAASRSMTPGMLRIAAAVMDTLALSHGGESASAAVGSAAAGPKPSKKKRRR